MECPKCGGGAFLAEEELVQVLENTEPVKILIRAKYQCRACSETFSRIVYDDMNARKKVDEPRPMQQYPSQPQQQYAQQSYDKPSIVRTSEDDAAESLKFF